MSSYDAWKATEPVEQRELDAEAREAASTKTKTRYALRIQHDRAMQWARIQFCVETYEGALCRILDEAWISTKNCRVDELMSKAVHVLRAHRREWRYERKVGPR